MFIIHGNNPSQKIINKIQSVNYPKHGAAVTIGNFDGVHLGHHKIINSLSDIALNENLSKVVITFEPRPVDYFAKINQKPIDSSRISLLSDKLRQFKKHQIDFVWVINFNSTTANTSAEDFLAKIFSVLNIKYLLIGRDFRFGKNRAGDIALLQDYSVKNNIKLQLIDDYKINNARVSSSLIRNILSKDYASTVESNIALNIANRYLGRHYGFTGRVIKGQQQGRNLGYPTINIYVKPKQLLLQTGVYAVNIIYNNKKYFAMANWGVRPTIAKKIELVLEAHLFDFDQDLYGQKVYIEFIAKVRSEQKFNSLEALIKQLGQDKQTVQKYFS